MNLYPQDLGDTYCAKALRNRVHRQEWRVFVDKEDANAVATVPPAAREAARKNDRRVLQTLSGSALATLIGALVGNALGVLTMILLISVLVWRAIAKNQAQTQGIPLSVAELRTLRQDEDDPLKQRYLELVEAIIKKALAAGNFSEGNARDAVLTLGTAVNALSVQDHNVLPADAVKIRSLATSLASQAGAEDDPVVAASQQRRAETLRRLADTISHVQTVTRRGQALRDELSDQINAFRLSLAASAPRQEYDGSGLAALAAQVQQVATEAGYVTAARTELDEALQPGLSNTGDAPRVQTVHQR